MENLEFKLHPSKFYCFFLSFTLLMSVVIVIVLPIAVWLCAIMVAVLVVYGATIFWRFALLKAPLSIIRLRQREARNWQVTTNSIVTSAVLRGDSTVTTVVAVLRFDFASRTRPVSCMIFRDSMGAEEYRRLVGLVRMG